MPSAVWAIVILVILAIPLKIISDGYLPGDDALRHAAKAVSGKPWGDILVLGPAFRDQNFVWHFFLRQVFLWSHCDADKLVIFAVAGLFAVLGWSPLPWLKRPEAWLITLTIVDVDIRNDATTDARPAVSADPFRSHDHPLRLAIPRPVTRPAGGPWRG